MDIIDIALQEGEIGKIRFVFRGSNKETEIQNGIVPLQFFQKPLYKAQEQDFARLKRLLPRP